MLDRIEKLIEDATGKPWFFDNGIAPGSDVFEAEDIEEFAQIMRQLAPLMLEVVRTQTEPPWDAAKAISAKDALDAYCAEHLPEVK
jgi:hypothetical protein